MKKEMNPLILCICLLIANMTPGAMAAVPTLLEKCLVALAGYTVIFSALFLEAYLVKLERELQELTWKRLFGVS